jgi:DNA repair protein RadD
MQLRPYQRAAIDAVFAYWAAAGGSPLIDLATGAGKSLVIAQICRELLEQFPTLRIGVLAHQKELLSQNTQELLKLWPAAPVGLYSAGLGRRDMRARILVMGIQSVWKKAALLGGFDLLLVDEAHLIPRDAETRYGKFIADCRAIVPDMRILGLTATPYRLGSGRLDEGEGKMFDKTVYTYDLAAGVRDGYLCPIIAPHRNIDLTAQGSMHVRGGEFIDGELEAASMAIIREAAADYAAIRRHDRVLGLAYCAGVKSAEMLADELNRLGEPARAITGSTSDRDAVIEAVKRRQSGLRHLIFCQIGTTGLNIPHADLVGMFTSTLSTSKYVQIGGRVSRMAEGKEFAIFADYGGVVRRHGPLDSIVVRSKGGVAGKAEPSDVRSKECPNCHNEVAIQTRTCPYCEHKWQVNTEPKHEARADSEAVIMASITPPKWLAVTEVDYSRHPGRDGKPDSMRVDYMCGLKTYSEWVPFESPKGRGLAEQWWRRRAGYQSPTPTTVAEALSRDEELPWPTEIAVRPDPQNGKYMRVVAHKLAPREVAA